MEVRIPTDAELGLTSTDLVRTDVTLETPLMLSDMVNVPFGDSLWDAFLSQLTVEEMAKLCGDAGYR